MAGINPRASPASLHVEPSKKASGWVVSKEIPPTPLWQRGDFVRLTWNCSEIVWLRAPS